MTVPHNAVVSRNGAPAEADTSEDMRGHAVRGAAWMTGLRWSVRLLSIFNTAILARLLTPADFGLMAMANLALAVVAVLGLGGEDLALIRMGRPTREYLDSAWALRIITSFLLFICTLAMAPVARWYFESQKVELLIYVISLRVLLEGLSIHQFNRHSQSFGSGRHLRRSLMARRRPRVNQESRPRASLAG